MVEKENIKNRIGDDLIRRNNNWDTLQDQVNKMSSLESRVDTIITTPVGGAATQQEIVDARDGEATLGKNIEGIKSKADRQEAIHHKLAHEVSKSQQEVASINVNQEAKQVAEGRRVVGLPETTGEGHGSFGLQGLTATNLIENGDFRDGLGFTEGNQGVTTTFTGSIMRIEATRALSSLFRSFGRTRFKYAAKGEILYYAVRVKRNKPTQKMFDGSVFTIGSYTEEDVGEWRTLTTVRTNQRDHPNTYIYINTDTSEIGDYMELDYIQVINLTQTFGAGNEPTKEECDVIFANYFEGTQSVNGNVRVKSVGKNLFDESKVLNNHGLTGTGQLISHNSWNVSGFVRVQENKRYSLDNAQANSSSIGIAYYDINKQLLDSHPYDGTYDYGNFRTFNKPVKINKFPVGTRYVRFSKYKFHDESVMFYEQDLSDTYSPYTESTLYLNAPKLRSLPNGVSDSIEWRG